MKQREGNKKYEEKRAEKNENSRLKEEKFHITNVKCGRGQYDMKKIRKRY